MTRTSWLLIVPLLLAAVSAPMACVEFRNFTYEPSGGSGGMAGASTSTGMAGTGGTGGMGGMAGMGGGSECDQLSDCVETECKTAGDCINGVCVWNYIEDGTKTDSQLYGDCKDRACDGNGGVKLIDGDLTKDTYNWANPCYVNACDALMMATANVGATCTTSWGDTTGHCDDMFKCIKCTMNADCGPADMCQGNRCIPMTCSDTFMNGTETAIDCGGPDCAPCAAGTLCTKDVDCEGICDSLMTMMCAAPSCADGKRNVDETDIDCGGSCVKETPAKKCADLKKCLFPTDCESGVCYVGECQPGTCTDYTQNQGEVSIDCGGPCLGPCMITP